MHAAIFGNVTAIIHGQYSSNFRYRKESQQIQEFIRYYNIKNPLARRLREFSRHTWSQTKGTNMPKVGRGAARGRLTRGGVGWGRVPGRGEGDRVGNYLWSQTTGTNIVVRGGGGGYG